MFIYLCHAPKEVIGEGVGFEQKKHFTKGTELVAAFKHMKLQQQQN